MIQYKRLIQAADKSFFLFGARGTGKSTWLKEEFPDALWVDLLDEKKYQTYLARPEEFSELVSAAAASKWIIIDEVQRLPQLLNSVHQLIESEHRKFVLCGSSARKLKQAGTNLLAGRASRRFAFPLTPEELGEDFDLNLVLTFGSIALIWQSGDRRETLEDYTQLYLREEIQAEALVRNLPAFARFLPIAALLHSKVLSISSLARDAEAHRNTIAGYIDVLEDTLIAFRLPAFQAQLRVKEKKHPKLYFIDSGLVRALKKQLFPLLAQEEIGELFEGWVVNYANAINTYFKLGFELSYWSPTNSKVEVDLLLTRNKEHIAIEIKSSSRLHRDDYSGLEAISDLPGLKRRILIYRGTEFRLREGIEIVPIEQFISEGWLKKLG